MVLHGSGAIVHAGTFFGDFLAALGRLPNRVYAFEPVMENFMHARHTLTMNFDFDHNVKLTHGALGDKNEVIQIMWRGGDGLPLGGASRFGYSVHNVRDDQLEYTEVFRLDDLIPIEEPVSIIQLDVEGHEEQALRGAMEIIKKHKPDLILERWFPEMLDSEFYQNEIFPLGYKEVGMLHDNVVLTV